MLLASCGWFVPFSVPDRTGTSLVPSQRLTAWPAGVGLGLLQCSHWMEQRSDVNHVAHSSGLASLEDLECQRGSRSSSARFSGRYFQQNTFLFDGDTLSPVQHNPPARLKAQEHPGHHRPPAQLDLLSPPTRHRHQPWRREGLRCGISRLVWLSCSPVVYFLPADPETVSIKKILNLNEAVEPTEADDANANGSFLAPAAPILKDGRPIWKVLVFDVSTAASCFMGRRHCLSQSILKKC